MGKTVNSSLGGWLGRDDPGHITPLVLSFEFLFEFECHGREFCDF